MSILFCRPLQYIVLQNQHLYYILLPFVTFQPSKTALQSSGSDAIMTVLPWETGVNPVRGRRRNALSVSRFHGKTDLIISRGHRLGKYRL